MQKLSFRSPGKFETGMAAENCLLRWMADTPKAAGIRMLQEAWTDSCGTTKSLYWAKVPMPKPKKNADNMEKKWLPFLLPHGWLPDYFLQSTAWQERMPEEGNCLTSSFAKACESYGEPIGNIFPLDLHGDGVPAHG